MKMKKQAFMLQPKSILGAILLLISVTSCVPLKKSVYLQENSSKKKVVKPGLGTPDSYRVQTNDNLFIRVFSAEETTNAFFNLSQANTYLNSEVAVDMGSYTVNENGEIDFPYVGKINVSDKTIPEIREIMQKVISEYDDQTSVFVKLVNRQITVLGEVNQPGRYSISKDHVTVFEAIGYAGDLTDYGNRKKVKIVRNVNGKKEVYIIDLTDRSLLLSDKYNLMPNDMVYVQPTNMVFGLKTMNLGVILSALSLSLGVYTTFYQ